MNNQLTKKSMTDPYIRQAVATPTLDKELVGFDTIRQIDRDEDLWFKLRGYKQNPLVDAALPLFGLVIRIRKIRDYQDIGELYGKVRNQIAAVSEEIHQYQYDSATQLAYRYCLCSFVDEAVMGTPWGAQSTWAERSLLSIFHDETWGGEKFFTILSRMLMEPQKYQDMLEVTYYCLCLGFKGKYGVQFNSSDELQAIIKKLYRVLHELRGDTPEHLTYAQQNVASSRYRVTNQLPWWTPWAIAGGVLLIAYGLYSINLSATTQQVLQSLDNILRL